MKNVSGTAAARGAAPGRKAEQGLGELLRRLRTERSLSVRTLATRAGFSPSFISQVELNQASPSIASLQRLAVALGVTLGALFPDAGPAAAVTRAGGRRRLISWWSRARIEPLTPMGSRQPLEAVMITIAPDGSSGTRPHAHPVPQFAIVFDGELRLTLGGDVQTLGPSDSVTLDADAPHLWENAGKNPARLVIVSSRLAC